MFVLKSMHPGWLSNTYLVAEGPGGRAIVIDAGAPSEPIFRRIEEQGLQVSHVLCTHHHYDHVAEAAIYRDRLGVPVCGHRLEASLFGGLDLELEDGAEIWSGSLRVRVLHIPGHTLGQLAFVVGEHEVFTGDTLFRGSVGGTRGPGHTSFLDLKHSILDVLMSLPPQMTVRPGHADPTTIGEEWESNPFIRLWRGLDPCHETRCRAFGQPATLLLRAKDYDEGTKCWVRFEADGREDVVPGSKVITI